MYDDSPLKARQLRNFREGEKLATATVQHDINERFSVVVHKRSQNSSNKSVHRQVIDKRFALSTKHTKTSYMGLNSPGYTIGSQRFKLPAGDGLLKVTDGLSGELSVWPASSSIKGEKKQRLSMLNLQNDDVSASSEIRVPRPKFLIHLEEFIDQELSLLSKGGVPPGPSISRLGVYREASHYFLENFRSYKPFLSAILNEYEMLLETYNKRLQYIIPLKSRISFLQREAEEKLSKMEQFHEKETTSMKGKINELKHSLTEKQIMIDNLNLRLKSYKDTCQGPITPVIEGNNTNSNIISTPNSLTDDDKKIYESKLRILQSTLEMTEERMSELLALKEANNVMKATKSKPVSEIDRSSSLEDKLHLNIKQVVSGSHSKEFMKLQSELNNMKSEYSNLIQSTNHLTKSRMIMTREISAARELLLGYIPVADRRPFLGNKEMDKVSLSEWISKAIEAISHQANK